MRHRRDPTVGVIQPAGESDAALRIGANLNQVARSLNGVSKRLALLDEVGREGALDVDPVTGQELVELARENAQIVAELTGVMTEIRALLMDQWKGNLEEVLTGEGER